MWLRMADGKGGQIKKNKNPTQNSNTGLGGKDKKKGKKEMKPAKKESNSLRAEERRG